MESIIKRFSEEYPELDKAADKMACNIIANINRSAAQIKSECPYKAQGLLEQLIKKLEEAV